MRIRALDLWRAGGKVSGDEEWRKKDSTVIVEGKCVKVGPTLDCIAADIR